MTIAFAAMISLVGIVQSIVELTNSEPVQALEIFQQAPTTENLRAYEKNLEDQSCFIETLRPVMQYARFKVFGEAGAKALVGRDGWWFYRRSVEYLTQRADASSTHRSGRSAALSAIVNFRDQLANRGIQLLVIVVPGKPSVYPDCLSPGADGPLEHPPTKQLLSDLYRANVKVVDLHAAFAAERNNKLLANNDLLYLPRDTHWSPKGLHVAARTVAQNIRDLNVVPEGDTAYELKPVIASRRGDVVEMLQSPWITESYPMAEVQCQQVVSPDTGKLYEDTDDSPILVLGDSFLRIYERDEPGAAGFISHLAYALHRPLTSIVNDGGASTLVRQELARKLEMLEGKSLVVWEFVERDIRFGLEGWQHVKLTYPHDSYATGSKSSEKGLN